MTTSDLIVSTTADTQALLVDGLAVNQRAEDRWGSGTHVGWLDASGGKNAAPRLWLFGRTRVRVRQSASYCRIDMTPPTLLITSPQAKDYVRRGKLRATWLVSDSLSGFATNSGKLDGNAIKNGEEIDLFYLSIGSHTITVDATDKAGNSASASVTFRVVADIHSLRDTLGQTCGLHWVKENICDDLDRMLSKAEDAIEHSKPSVAKEQLNSFIKELDAKKGNGVNQQAYDLLKGDALYVIGTLP